MHELSVTESILEIALRHAANAQAKKVSDLYIVAGQLSSIVDDSVQFYWDIISKDTIAEGARLHFRRIPTELHCLDCNQTYKLNQSELVCPVCNGAHVKILTGEEFYLEAIEVEKK
jgi:hydrogenase nickel incorporation protein HypA/HybF